jgi:hypothetical protein
MTSLDRFSEARPGEGLKPSLEMLQELKEQDKKDMVYDYVDRYFDDCGRFPEVDFVLDNFSGVDLDDTMIEGTINHMKKHRKEL